MDDTYSQRNVAFLLSPANCSGRRAEIVMSPRASFELAVRLRTANGADLADVFSFLSGLYFRGKITYARRFQRPIKGGYGIRVITAGRGLMPADSPVGLEDLRRFAEVPIQVDNSGYMAPLRRDVLALAKALGPEGQVVLLGSIATDKYTKVLLEAFGERLLFPKEFVGRGDMSRGGLLLRHVDSGEELEYVPLHGAVRNGKRPAKLQPRS